MEKDNTSAKQNQAVKSSIDDRINTWQRAVLSAIEQAKEPEYLGDTPIVLPALNESALVNMVVADAGAGKSLLSRAVVQYLLDNYEDIVVVWVDLEFQEMVAKQRNIDKLMLSYPGRFYVVTQSHIAEIRESHSRINTTFAIVNALLSKMQETKQDKRFFVIVDSFEDLVEDTSNDTELKRHMNKLLEKKSIAFLFNHHVNKDTNRHASMRFRGSMVIKAKLTTLLMIQNKTKEDDFTVAFELVALKVRTAYPPTNKLTIRVDTLTWSVKDMVITADLEEIRILKSLYFVLRKNNEMQKTALINEVSQETRKRREKVRSVLQKYARFFNVSKGIKNEEKVSLTSNLDLLDELCVVIGVQNKNYTEKQRELWKEVSNMNDNDEINIRLRRDGGIVEYRLVKTLKNYVSSLSDNEIDEVLRQLRAKKVSHSKTNETEQVDEKELDMIIEGGF